MTLIGAFSCQNSVVILADRQETISDYAKWDQGKIYLLEQIGQYRIVMAGAGDPDPINEIWERLTDPRIRKVGMPPYAGVKDLILKTVNEVTKKTIYAVPKDQRPHIEVIWAIQPLEQNRIISQGHIQLFRTLGLSSNLIRTHYFTGNPVLLTKYLSDMYLQGVVIGAKDAEALAAYILWEAKEYDPTCGKYSDIFTLYWSDSSISRMTLPELKYWEEHFEYVKNSMRLVPLLSCAADLTKHVYNRDDHLNRLATTIKTLADEQEKMRKKESKERSKLETKLHQNLVKAATKFNKPPKTKT